MTRIRVLIIDDSRTMRAIIRSRLHSDPNIVVVDEAGDAQAGWNAIARLAPDVITLDVEMPGMSGLEFLARLMRERPTPVIMVSSQTQAGSAASIEALSSGAFECVAKPTGQGVAEAFQRLPQIVKAAVQAPRRRADVARPSTPAGPTGSFETNDKIVVIGASTGGVEALMTVLSSFPASCPPTLITQHMPASFTTSFAHRLNQHCAPQVQEAADGALLRPGYVNIAPGSKAHLEIQTRGVLKCQLRPGPPQSGHRPSVDALFHSAALLGTRIVGVLLTGMGRDGAEGLLAIRRAGGQTIGQDASTSVVYGMPRVAAEIGAVESQLAIQRIAAAVLERCRSTRGGGMAGVIVQGAYP